MTEQAYEKQCLRETLLAMLPIESLTPGDLRQAFEEFRAVSMTPLEPKLLEELARKPPTVPVSFFETWADRFAAWAVETMLPEKTAMMCDGSAKGRMLALLEYYEYQEENAEAFRADLDALAKANGAAPAELLFVLEAVSTWRERKLRRGSV